MAVVLNNGLNTMERVYDKTKNNLAYGTMFGLTGATYLAVKGKPQALKTIGKGAGIGLSYVGRGAYKVGSKVATKLGIAKECSAVKGFVVNTGKKVVNVLTTAKNSGVGQTIINGLKGVGTAIGNMVSKLPKKGVLGAIAIGLGGLMVILSHKHGYNAGKIDQAYQERKQAINGFQI